MARKSRGCVHSKEKQPVSSHTPRASARADAASTDASPSIATRRSMIMPEHEPAVGTWQNSAQRSVGKSSRSGSWWSTTDKASRDAGTSSSNFASSGRTLPRLATSTMTMWASKPPSRVRSACSAAIRSTGHQANRLLSSASASAAARTPGVCVPGHSAITFGCCVSEGEGEARPVGGARGDADGVGGPSSANGIAPYFSMMYSYMPRIDPRQSKSAFTCPLTMNSMVK
mmetsp:Transcript_12481/g.39449  ORF Transcript_12481/g.39449 Transcript_12481/m.39449 type:complete len:229 (+) Transcript_12481:2791-3477(+)